MDSGCQNENEQCLGGSSMKPRTTEPSRLSLYGGGAWKPRWGHYGLKCGHDKPQQAWTLHLSEARCIIT